VYAYELGYRVEPIERVSFDAAAYFNHYDNVIIYVPGNQIIVPVPFEIIQPVATQNGGKGNTYGGEVSGQWQPLDNLRITASYSLLKSDFQPGGAVSQNAPKQQAQLRAYFDLTSTVELNGDFSYVDRVKTLNLATPTTVPSYMRLDLGVIWRPVKSLELGIWGQNLLQAHHQEFTSDTPTFPVEIPRSVLAKITFRF
jgi:iron complex outermembrane receptor protein